MTLVQALLEKEHLKAQALPSPATASLLPLLPSQACMA
jgi:hypothetical protein